MSPERQPAGARLAQLEELEVEVEKLVAGGDGLARFEGIPIFVPRSAPGDRLRVRLVERRSSFGRAEIVEVLAPGPGRRSPPCPYFERCGGCDLQHLEDDRQVSYKAAAVRETLERLGGIAWPQETEVVAGEAWAWRLRTQLHTERQGGGVEVGYFERRSHRLVAVERCPILVPELEAVLPELPGLLAERTPRRLDLAASDDGRVTAAPALESLGRGAVTRRVGEWTFAFDARCFFQGHAGLLQPLVERVVGPWEGEAAFDLYCGVGLFTLPLARRYGRVVGVDGDRVAVRYLRKNARAHHLAGVEAVAQAVESWIGALPQKVSRVLVDPPRVGLPPPVRQLLLERRPGRISYVSCHAAALARDLKELLQTYRLERLALLDLFPQSGHMEVVAQLAAA